MTFAPLKPEQKRRVACCQAGIAVAALKLSTRRTLVRVQIYPQCRALGLTEIKANAVQKLSTVADQQVDLQVTMSGRAAEEVIFGDKSPLSGSDLVVANAMVKALVTRYGVKEPEEKIFTNAFDAAKKFAEANQAAIVKVADALCARGELSAAEVEAIVASIGPASTESC